MLRDGNGSTEIAWDTGNGSMGFVFVTEDGGKPVLFANGSRGSQIAPWIGKHAMSSNSMATISGRRCSLK